MLSFAAILWHSYSSTGSCADGSESANACYCTRKLQTAGYVPWPPLPWEVTVVVFLLCQGSPTSGLLPAPTHFHCHLSFILDIVKLQLPIFLAAVFLYHCFSGGQCSFLFNTQHCLWGRILICKEAWLALAYVFPMAELGPHIFRKMCAYQIFQKCMNS